MKLVTYMGYLTAFLSRLVLCLFFFFSLLLRILIVKLEKVMPFMIGYWYFRYENFKIRLELKFEAEEESKSV